MLLRIVRGLIFLSFSHSLTSLWLTLTPSSSDGWFARGEEMISPGQRGSDAGLIPPDDRIAMYFAGDVTLAHRFEEAIGDSVHKPFADFHLFRNADVAFVNLENPITVRGRKRILVEGGSASGGKKFNFRMNPKYLVTLKDAGVSVVNLANNHILDYGVMGLLDTIERLDSAGIRHCGAGRNLEEARAPVILEIRGHRIAILGYWGGGAGAAGVNKPGVAPRDLQIILGDVRSARTEHKADIVIVSLHWGNELDKSPRLWQRTFAHRIIDAGANVVVGSHSHTIQPVESYHGGIIAYSLGNFLFGGNQVRQYDTSVLEVVAASAGLHSSKKLEWRLIPVRVTNGCVHVLPRIPRGKPDEQRWSGSN
ncbi:MAG: CapA family protein [Bacteroidota bacterium]